MLMIFLTSFYFEIISHLAKLANLKYLLTILVLINFY